MTRQDYEVIAKAFADTRPRDTQFARKDQWNACVAEMVVLLAKDNPRFDPNKFVEACGG